MYERKAKYCQVPSIHPAAPSLGVAVWVFTLCRVSLMLQIVFLMVNLQGFEYCIQPLAGLEGN